ncbi:MAG TPA: hypothetical protein DEP84_19025 [Chloroflexi bacterium]|nr:hypothetical protein [Chloroflexota bacterium]
MNEALSPSDEPVTPSATVQTAMAAIEQLLGQRSQIRNPEQLQQVEREIIVATDRLASAIVAQKLQAALDEPEVQQEAAALIKQAPKKLKNQGRRRVTVRPSRGPAFEGETSYYRPNRTGSRKKSRRLSGPAGSGRLRSLHPDLGERNRRAGQSHELGRSTPVAQ